MRMSCRPLWETAQDRSAFSNHVEARTACVEPGSSRENGCHESFNCKLRDELLNGEIFFSLKEAQLVIENWRRHYKPARPHSHSSPDTDSGTRGYRLASVKARER
jgi:hypothetical protein